MFVSLRFFWSLHTFACSYDKYPITVVKLLTHLNIEMHVHECDTITLEYCVVTNNSNVGLRVTKLVLYYLRAQSTHLLFVVERKCRIQSDLEVGHEVLRASVRRCHRAILLDEAEDGGHDVRSCCQICLCQPLAHLKVLLVNQKRGRGTYLCKTMQVLSKILFTVTKTKLISKRVYKACRYLVCHKRRVYRVMVSDWVAGLRGVWQRIMRGASEWHRASEWCGASEQHRASEWHGASGRHRASERRGANGWWASLWRKRR